MKRIILSLSFCGIFIIVNAQVNRNIMLEKLRSELLPQTEDDNPFKYVREKRILSELENMINNEKTDYEIVKEKIEYFHTLDMRCHKLNRWITRFIRDISFFSCRESYDFLEEQIKNNPLEEVRYTAIVMLAWSLDTNYLPCILEYAQKDSLSVQEKLAVASAFQTYGIYTFNSELKEKAIRILDEVCYDFSSNYVVQTCKGIYYELGGQSAIDFCNVWVEQETICAGDAMLLVGLGMYEKALPIFVECIHHCESAYEIYIAMRGLAIIGTEEAIRLIEEQTYSKNEMVVEYAREVLKYLDKERRKE